MGNTIIIANRLNWIDWAKAIAITFVVFGHIPMVRGSFIQNYIVTFHMPLFFFISGYLTKMELFNKVTFNKYTHTLIIPYLIYNIISYPFWTIKHYLEYPDSGWVEYIKPIIGIFFLQQETAYSSILAGVTWFLLALLFMKILLSICNKFKYGHFVFFFIAIACAVFYINNEFYRYTINLTRVGLTKCLPFYFIGYICKERNVLPTDYQKSDWAVCTICILISLFAYQFCRFYYSLSTYGFFFWTICLSAIWGLLSLCRLLNHIHSKLILNTSIGTMVIMGFHGMLITTINFIISKILNTINITYSWYVTVILSIGIVISFYPLIIFFQKKYPFMLGKFIKSTS